MRKINLIYTLWLVLIGIFVLILNGYTQPLLPSKDLGSGILVKFPFEPTYSLKGKAGVYTAKTNNCLLITIVQYDVTPKYQEFVTLSQMEQQKLIEILLDNMIKGILVASGNDGSKFSRIHIGRNSAREASFIGINPANGQQATKLYKVLYAYNKTYTFQVMKLTNDNKADEETNAFLNSIVVK